MAEPHEEAAALVAELVDGRTAEWDRTGALPADLLRELAGRGLLCPQVPAEHGGPGLSALQAGEFTASVGALCGSLRSLLTAQGIAAWTVQRFGDARQRSTYLTRLATGAIAGVAFSEPDAGSDLSAITTTIRPDGADVVLDGDKVWVTGACYADLFVVFGRHADAAAAVVVPATAHGVRVERIPDPLGFRAAGHGNVRLDAVRVPAAHVLGGGGHPLGVLVSAALTYGRLSVAWGCVGMIRCCLGEAARHARLRTQFGQPLSRHQLVARHLAEMLVAEQAATRACEHASRCWDRGDAESVPAAVVAKHLASRHAAQAAAAALQVLGSAAAHDAHPVARAYREAKLMELIEGSTEISQLMLGEHALSVWS